MNQQAFVYALIFNCVELCVYIVFSNEILNFIPADLCYEYEILLNNNNNS